MTTTTAGGRRALSSSLAVLIALHSGTPGQAQSGSLVIADFEAGRVETVLGLAIPVVADEQLGGMSSADLSIVRPGAQGSRHALRVSFRMLEGFATPFSGVWIPIGDEGLATDLSAYKGLRFQARCARGSYYAAIGRYTGVAARYVVPIEVEPEWTVIELPFESFEKSTPAGAPLPFAPTGVSLVGFGAARELRGQFELEIDQVEIYK